MHLPDRVVVVTGAAGGIGSCLCVKMGRAGARIGMIDRDAASLEQIKQKLDAAGITCVSAVADVSIREQVGESVRAIEAALGPADILVAAAGICGVTTFDDLQVQRLEQIMQVNFFGTVYAIEAVLPGMLQRKRGQIVGLASLAAVCPLPFEKEYSASKAAVASYFKSLGPPLRRRGIEVTCVFPGFVQTPMLDKVVAETSKTHTPIGTVGADAAAERILDTIKRGQRAVFFPFLLTFATYVSSALPGPAFDWAMARMAIRRGVPY